MAAKEIAGQSLQPGMATDEGDVPRENSNSPSVPKKDGPPKKRRRLLKPNAEKKFECKHGGCDKSYTRAEHLYRHQLNHTPKNIYHCDFPDCNRYFVRQDLCVRHRERHTTAGSQLNKRDTFAQASQSQTKALPNATPSNGADTQHEDVRDHEQQNEGFHETYNSIETISMHTSTYQKEQQNSVSASILSPSSNNNNVDPRFMPPTPRTNTGRTSTSNQRSNSFGGNPLSPDHVQPSFVWQQRRESMTTSTQRPSNIHNMSQSVPQSPSRTYSSSSISTHHPPQFRNNSDNYQRAADYLQSTEPIAGNYTSHVHMSNPIQDSYPTTMSHSLNAMHTDPYLFSHANGSQLIDTSNTYGQTIFGFEDYAKSPFLLNDEFTAWLFNPNVADQSSLSPDLVTGPYPETATSQPQERMLPHTSSPETPLPAQSNSAQNHPKMSVHSVLESSQLSNYIMSENKRQELLDLMLTQFVERPHDAVKKRKDMVFEGNVDDDGHILSLRMMHTYIGSYWYHQHAQLPILHKPTFSADRTPTLLLLVVIAIGAATLDKAYGTTLTDSAAEFANFVVWHLRWEIIRDVDFRPPAKLWVFQTLLLIEVYEKMYSSRTLHERAHVHHDTTLTSMRRGSSLVGRSASETPPVMEERNGRPVNGAAHDEPDSAWHKWITTEATRRAAFGAFVLDSIHCTMFGHSAKMAVHEMRLPLPCDEALWSATSPAEVGRVQASLRTNGIKPIMFAEGLKRTLNGQTVRTNSFGRTIIIAGLLSVSWHMSQRDLQIASIGPRAANSIGGPDKWKGTLLRAFDNWKRDFDEALAESAINAPLSPARIGNSHQHTGASLLRPVDDENIFESRTVLHHLAHIAAHVDIVDCQVFAGANRLLSRSVTPRDYSLVCEKIEKWATRASARDSAFYALKFITTVLSPPSTNDGSDNIDSRIYGHASPILPQAYESDRYIARDDFLLNRPWVLYISTLVVWCYGFALEGPIDPPPREEDFTTYEQRERDMRSFLDRVAGVRAPDDLEGVSGKNRCLGLLLILKESFASTRWELTHEAAGMLGNAAMKLMGKGGKDIVGSNIEALGRLGSGRHGIGTNGRMNGTGTGHGEIGSGVEYGNTTSAFNTARP